MSLFLSQTEKTQKNRIKELGLFIDGNVQGRSFVHRQTTNLINKQHGTPIICMEMRAAVENSIMTNSLMSFTT